MSDYMWGDVPTQFFYELDQDRILNAVDALGFRTTGRCLAMNSMENRVYETEIEVDESKIISVSEKAVIAKFYRPGRWTKNQILEEHAFLWELKDLEIPVIAPLKFDNQTLFKMPETNLYYCVFPKQGGRNPDEMNDEQLRQLGRLLARIHNIGAAKDAKYRVELSPDTYGYQNLDFMLDQNIIPSQFKSNYEEVVEQICEVSFPWFEQAHYQRVHGDCHWGNILFKDDICYFIDFDDMVMAPAVQDLWLCLPGRDEYTMRQRSILLEGYESMRPFDYSTLRLIEPLRALRFIHFSAWIAKRWEDPAFKNAFPHFGTDQYWQMQVQDLQDQLNLINNFTS